MGVALEGVFLVGVALGFLVGVALDFLAGVVSDVVLLVGVVLVGNSCFRGEEGLEVEGRSTTLSIISFSFLVGHWRQKTSHVTAWLKCNLSVGVAHTSGVYYRKGGAGDNAVSPVSCHWHHSFRLPQKLRVFC